MQGSQPTNFGILHLMNPKSCRFNAPQNNKITEKSFLLLSVTLFAFATPDKLFCSILRYQYVAFLRLHFLSVESEKMRASGALLLLRARQGGAGRKAQTPPCGADLMSHRQTISGQGAQNLAGYLEHFYEIDFVVIQSVDIPVSSGV